MAEKLSHKKKKTLARKHMTQDEFATYKDHRTGQKSRISIWDSEWWKARKAKRAAAVKKREQKNESK